MKAAQQRVLSTIIIRAVAIGLAGATHLYYSTRISPENLRINSIIANIGSILLILCSLNSNLIIIRKCVNENPAYLAENFSYRLLLLVGSVPFLVGIYFVYNILSLGALAAGIVLLASQTFPNSIHFQLERKEQDFFLAQAICSGLGLIATVWVTNNWKIPGQEILVLASINGAASLYLFRNLINGKNIHSLRKILSRKAFQCFVIEAKHHLILGGLTVAYANIQYLFANGVLRGDEVAALRVAQIQGDVIVAISTVVPYLLFRSVVDKGNNVLRLHMAVCRFQRLFIAASFIFLLIVALYGSFVYQKLYDLEPGDLAMLSAVVMFSRCVAVGNSLKLMFYIRESKEAYIISQMVKAAAISIIVAGLAATTGSALGIAASNIISELFIAWKLREAVGHKMLSSDSSRF